MDVDVAVAAVVVVVAVVAVVGVLVIAVADVIVQNKQCLRSVPTTTTKTTAGNCKAKNSSNNKNHRLTVFAQTLCICTILLVNSAGCWRKGKVFVFLLLSTASTSDSYSSFARLYISVVDVCRHLLVYLHYMFICILVC